MQIIFVFHMLMIMNTHNDFENNDAGKQQLKRLIKEGKIHLAGNSSLQIYGRLSCKSGKRMKRKNRVFFESAQEAVENGYRPCGHCMKQDYLVWIEGMTGLRHR
jgi:hypothetical protein